MSFFETLYSWCGVDFAVFSNLRLYFNDTLFQSFFLLASIIALVVALLYYFVITNIKVQYSKLGYWLLFLLIAAVFSALVTYLWHWSNIAQAKTQNIGQPAVINAINEGMLKYAFGNFVITGILYFIISLIIKRFNPHTTHTPFKIRKSH